MGDGQMNDLPLCPLTPIKVVEVLDQILNCFANGRIDQGVNSLFLLKQWLIEDVVLDQKIAHIEDGLPLH